MLHTFAETMPNIQPCSRPQLSISGLSSCVKGLYYLAEIHVTQPGWCHKANNAAISSGERCCMHSANRIAFNSPCNSEEEELSPLHLRLCLPPPPQLSAAGHISSRQGCTVGSFAGALSLNCYAFAVGVCLFLFNFSRRLHTDTIKSRLIQYLWPLLLHYSLSHFYVLLHFLHRH